MKKLVLKLDLANVKEKQKVMTKVSGMDGVISVAIDMEKKKMTVMGDVDAVKVASKLRKLCYAEIETLGEDKKDDKKDDKKTVDVAELLKTYPWLYHHYQPYPPVVYAEENPYPCVIC
ncbi:heavy metal-associated isoprenylated plant protein 39-like [Punica granatum]|uniref:Uncharacterized protein n=2 Tax=Punica granatum TaxID=22663 RepID=A0A2I0J4D6_PUNGR|nr:heavy metal-associated isoprenylated plant protein 39-like [Punica granatum]PKI50923.1 hypothetical protein CRG98_028653 [Punica granatum]